MENIESISFSGGGWVGMYYYIGVLRYITKKYPNQQFITLGASAGALISTILQLIQHNFTTLEKFEQDLEVFEKNVAHFPIFLEKRIRKFCDDFIQLSDKDFVQFNHKLYVSYTQRKTIFLENMLINPISINQLKEILIFSSMMPVLVGINFSRMDGFFSNNQPILNEKTLKINCIYSYGADISPSEWINPIDIFKIPSQEKKDYLIKMGYYDIRAYFESKNTLK